MMWNMRLLSPILKKPGHPSSVEICSVINWTSTFLLRKLERLRVKSEENFGEQEGPAFAITLGCYFRTIRRQHAPADSYRYSIPTMKHNKI